MTSLRTTSCLLFFPGTHPDLFPKAIASGAGLVCADLEDAVAADAKELARASVLDLFRGSSTSRLVVRINHPSGREGEADLAALAGLDGQAAPLTIVLPKSEDSAEVDHVRDRLAPSHEGVRIIPMIETARGLAEVESIARTAGVSAMLFGGLDLSTDLGCALDWEALLYARSRCVLAARLAGVDLLDTPFFDVHDTEGLRLEAERARRLGFHGKAAIHPTQVAVVHRAFEPSAEELDRARRVIVAFEREGRGALLVDGVMVDRPAVAAARRLLTRSGSEEV